MRHPPSLLRQRAGGLTKPHSPAAVAERTFLFLSERRQQYGKGELKHDPDWIQKHLVVLEVRSIELVRSLNSAQGLKRSTASASACAKLAPNGDVHLYISQSIEVDFFEVAMSLNKLLLVKTRPNDALLLLTILQTTCAGLPLPLPGADTDRRPPLQAQEP